MMEEPRYLQPGFDANRLTISELISALSQHGVEMPPTRQRKQFYVELFQQQLQPFSATLLNKMRAVQPSSDGVVFMDAADVVRRSVSFADENSDPSSATRKLAIPHPRLVHKESEDEEEVTVPARKKTRCSTIADGLSDNDVEMPSRIPTRKSTRSSASPAQTRLKLSPSKAINVPSQDRFMIMPTLPGLRSRVSGSPKAKNDGIDENSRSIQDILVEWERKIDKDPTVPKPFPLGIKTLEEFKSLHSIDAHVPPAAEKESQHPTTPSVRKPRVSAEEISLMNPSKDDEESLPSVSLGMVIVLVVLFMPLVLTGWAYVAKLKLDMSRIPHDATNIMWPPYHVYKAFSSGLKDPMMFVEAGRDAVVELGATMKFEFGRMSNRAAEYFASIADTPIVLPQYDDLSNVAQYLSRVAYRTLLIASTLSSRVANAFVLYKASIGANLQDIAIDLVESIQPASDRIAIAYTHLVQNIALLLQSEQMQSLVAFSTNLYHLTLKAALPYYIALGVQVEGGLGALGITGSHIVLWVLGSVLVLFVTRAGFASSQARRVVH